MLRAILSTMLDPAEVDASELRPIDRRQYHRLGELGFWSDERVELLDGVVVKMTPMGWPHSKLHALVLERLVKAVPARLLVQAGGPLAASRFSEPLPDISVVERKVLRRRIASKALLIVEVSDSSLRKDRGIKARIYAKAGVRDYWIVNAKTMTIEVHRDPLRGHYRSFEIHDRHAQVKPLLLPGITVCLDELLR